MTDEMKLKRLVKDLSVIRSSFDCDDWLYVLYNIKEKNTAELQKILDKVIEEEMEIDQLISEVSNYLKHYCFHEEDIKHVYLAIKRRDITALRRFSEVAYKNEIILENYDACDL